MEEDEDYDLLGVDRSETKREKGSEERLEKKEDRRTGLRCCQRDTETFGVHPGDLGVPIPVASDLLSAPLPVHPFPHHAEDSVVLDVELTAEVRVEDGSMLALFPSVIPGLLRTGKPGFFCDQLPSMLNWTRSAWTKSSRGYMLKSVSCPVSHSFCSRDVIMSPVLDGRTTADIAAPPSAMQTVKSPLPSSPSTSPSSPSSAPSSPSSSPSSSNSSPGGAAVSYHDNRSCAEGGAVTSATGDVVSSTSISMPPPSHALPSSSNPSIHVSSALPRPAPGRSSIEIYDPFHPTEGEGEREGRATDEENEVDEEDGDKYDPFDPTGSPVSERGRERGMGAQSDRMSSEVAGSKSRKSIFPAEMHVEGAAPRKKRDRGPSASSPSAKLQEEREQARGGDGKGARERGRERKHNESDNSEIEEGEIVAVGDRERDRRRDSAGERVLVPGSPFLHSCPKPERILRVLDGEDFVSVRAEGDWAVGRERDGVGDLRRKLVNRRKERYRSCCSSSLSPPPPLPPPPAVPAAAEKERSRKSGKSSKEREKRKRKQERDGKKEDKGTVKDRGSRERKERVSEREVRRGAEEKRREDDRGRSSRSNSSKRRRKNSSKRSSHSRSRLSSHRQKHRQHSSSSPSEDRRRDWIRDRERNRDRREKRERGRERDCSRKGKQKKERRDRPEKSSSKDGRGGSRKKAKEGQERRDGDRERDRRRQDGRPVVPPSIQDLNGSDLFAIKRTITVTTTATAPESSLPPPPQPLQESPRHASDKPRKKKKKRKRRAEEQQQNEDEEPLSRSRDSSITPLRYDGFDSDQFSEKLGVEVLSLDGEALDSDYPSLEDTPPPLPPPSPCPSPKPKSKSRTGRHVKKKLRTSKKSSLSEPSVRPKSPSSPSVTPVSPAALVPHLPAKRQRKAGKERDKGAKKEGGRSGKSKKLSRGARKAKLQSKVSVLVRDGVSSTTGGSGSGKRGIIVGASKDLPAQSGTAGGAVVGGSIAVVFRRDNESRSPFLKPCAEPVSMSGRSKDFSSKSRKGGVLSALAPPSSSSSSSSCSSHLSAVEPKKAKPSSTTSASSSSASSPSSASTTKQKRKQAKRDYREAVGGAHEDAGADDRCGIGGSPWGVAALDTQSSSSTSSTKPSSPLPRPLAPPPCPSSSSSAGQAPPSSPPPHTPPLPLPASRDTRESSPDSQTVDSSCKTPEAPFPSEDSTAPVQVVPSALPPSISSSPPALQTSLGAAATATAGSLSAPELKLVPDEPKAPASPPCSSSATSSASSTVASLALSLPTSSADQSSSASSSVSSSSTNKPPAPPPPPPTAPPLPWSLQTGVDCTAGGVLALTALLFKMEEANLASRAKAQEFIQATSQILSQANQSQSQLLPPASAPSSSSSSSSQTLPLPSVAPAPAPTPGQFILHGSLPLVGCTKTPPSHMHPGLSGGGGCAQTPPVPVHSASSGPTAVSGDPAWDGEGKDPDKYLKKLHTQERAVEEVKLAIKPYYQRKDITKDEYKDILRKAVHKICHSRTGEINPVKVSNLVKLYVQRYKYFRKHGRKMDEEEREGDREPAALHSSS
ncbi:splicing factor, arginine/serine-rich 19 isoform X2 [Scleropages formosus]|uniref:splicing factor, arginine/serine-rich 19 isoform X2 n=1 Tax=Scleropages formosus TaxID=113540 RepID=UPI0008787BC1|nr:splicing factor, arginine/serine-rich 19 isoform X2 [Scleropages formosus]